MDNHEALYYHVQFIQLDMSAGFLIKPSCQIFTTGTLMHYCFNFWSQDDVLLTSQYHLIDIYRYITGPGPKDDGTSSDTALPQAHECIECPAVEWQIFDIFCCPCAYQNTHIYLEFSRDYDVRISCADMAMYMRTEDT